MTPTAIVENAIPSNTPYVSVHIRCGDYVIPMPRHGGEKRLDINDTDVVEHILQRVAETQCRFPDHTLFIHSDCPRLKTTIVESNSRWISYPSVICHTAEEETPEGGYLSTTTEFFFMARASHIVQLGKYSGFSHMAAVYGSAPFSTDSPNDVIQAFSF